MKIALDCRCVFRGMGGIGRHTWCLMREMVRLDPATEFVCYFTSLSPPEPVPVSANLRIRICDAAMIDERFDQFVLPELLEADAVDLYHNPTFAVPLASRGIAIVSTVHDVVFRRHPELVEPRLRKFLDSATRRACRVASRLVTVSEFSRREIAELYGVDGARVQVIPNGVHPPRLQDPVAAPPVRGTYLLYVGSVEPKKNMDLVLAGLRDLRRSGALGNLKLVVAGSGSNSEAFAARLDHFQVRDVVEPLGYVEDAALEALYRDAWAFVYPSLYEGFGLPPVEAMLRGVPTIVSRASSLPEVVGDAAETVDAKDPAQFVQVIRKLLADDGRRRALGAAGRKRAAEFTWERSAKAHLDLYRACLAETRCA